MDNEVKERIPDYRDDDPGVILIETCKKFMQICSTYDLYEWSEWKAVIQAQQHALNNKYKADWADLANNVSN